MTFLALARLEESLLGTLEPYQILSVLVVQDPQKIAWPYLDRIRGRKVGHLMSSRESFCALAARQRRSRKMVLRPHLWQAAVII